MPQATSTVTLIKDEKQSRRLGTLEVNKDGKQILLPLTAVHIAAQVVGRIASVTVKQTFSNPYSDFLEAIYTFPLSGGVAVSKFEMKVKDKVLKGVVEERQQAQRQYTEALQTGKRAALLEQERDDVFTLSLGNIPPGESVEITVSYSERLAYFDNGRTEIRLPLVVGKRYIPGETQNGAAVGTGTSEDTDLVPDASRISPPRLAPGVNAALDLSVTVDVAVDGDSISDLSCSQHATSTSLKDKWISVSLARSDELMNRDFVLNWRAGAAQIASTVHFFKNENDPKQSYGMVTILPPRTDGFVAAARDVVFVLDRSGSMRGTKMSSAVRSCSILLETLSPKDRFTILAFDDRVEWMNAQPDKFFDADEDGLERGHKYLRTIDSRGGTELARALTSAITALEGRGKHNSRASIIVVLTDGEVGDEANVLKQIQKHLGDARVFTVGIDTAVNSGLLKRLASVGGGTASFVQPGTQLENALINVGREIGVPLVTDIALESKQFKIEDLAPSPVPDLFAGRAVTVFFRAPSSDGDLELSLTGKNHDGSTFNETLKASNTTTDAIAQLWAKTYVTTLEDRYRAGGGDTSKISKEIIAIAKSHSLLTKMTAFILVDESEIVNQDGSRRTVVQPVCEPAGWDMDDQLTTGNHPRISSVGSSSAQAFGSAAGAMSFGAGSPTLAESIKRKTQQSKDEVMQSALFGFSEPPATPPPSGQPAPQPMPSSAPPAPPRMAGGPPQAPSQSQASGSWANPSSSQASSSWSNPLPPIVDKLLGGAERARGASPTPPTPPSSAGQPAADNRSESGKALAKLATELYAALKTVLAQLTAGQKPDMTELVKVREALLKELANSDHASDLPELQRFIRVNLQELIAAANSPDSQASDLQKLGSRNEHDFTKVHEEIRTRLKFDITTGDTTKFWEASI